MSMLRTEAFALDVTSPIVTPVVAAKSSLNACWFITGSGWDQS